MIVNLISKWQLGNGYRGGSLFLVVFISILLFIALQLFRKGYAKIVTGFFLCLLFLINLFIVYTSGATNIFAIMFTIIYIIFASVILKGWNFFSSILLFLICYTVLGVSEVKNVIEPNINWKTAPTSYGDIVSVTIVLAVITLIFWIFNNELRKNIEMLKESELMIKKERDLLEEKVVERTKQLQVEQAERINQLSRFAEFGRLANGIFHDLINPLTALSLNLNQIKKFETSATELDEYINGALIAANNMNKLIGSSKNYLQHKIHNSSFCVKNEVEDICQILKLKAQKIGVKLVSFVPNNIVIYGNRTRFSQLMSNLILNAIEAYNCSKKNMNNFKQKQIEISSELNKQNITITVKDYACGIDPNIKITTFEPFYSSKSNFGNTGIGLTMCKDIVESDFSGTIDVESKHLKGSKFIITIPNNRKIDRNV